MITVVVADDQTMIRDAFVALVGLEADLQVVGHASSAAQVLTVAEALRPDVILMDVQMPGDAVVADGIAATSVITTRYPSTRVIIVTTFGRPGYLSRAMAAGAAGFMIKDAPADHLIEGIRRVASGLRVIDPELAADSLSAGASPLSDRESQVLRAAGLGGGTAEIAARVFLSEGTVRNYLSAAMGKLGVSTRTEAVRIATEMGWLG